jgi:hypothetical protein
MHGGRVSKAFTMVLKGACVKKTRDLKGTVSLRKAFLKIMLKFGPERKCSLSFDYDSLFITVPDFK